MRKPGFYVINAITLYRLLAAPVLVVLIFTGNTVWFKWLLAVSFFTDAIDGFLARKFKVVSLFGSKLDSIADDLTILAAIIGAIVLKPEFFRDNLFITLVVIFLLLFQNIIALVRYRKLSSFHTYLAKISAVLQGCFLILLFFLPEPVYPLFYVAAVFTIVDQVEEIILVMMLPKWKANVKGIYWVMKNRTGFSVE